MPSLRSSSLREPPPRLLAMRRAAGLLQSKLTSSGDGRSKAWLFFSFYNAKKNMISRQTSRDGSNLGLPVIQPSSLIPQAQDRESSLHSHCSRAWPITSADTTGFIIPTTNPPITGGVFPACSPASPLGGTDQVHFAESEQAHLWGQLPALPRVPSRMPLTTFNVI